MRTEEKRSYIENAEANGGSVSEIIAAVKKWNGAECHVAIKGDRVFVDDIDLCDAEIESFFDYCQGLGPDRNGND